MGKNKQNIKQHLKNYAESLNPDQQSSEKILSRVFREIGSENKSTGFNFKLLYAAAFLILLTPILVIFSLSIDSNQAKTDKSDIETIPTSQLKFEDTQAPISSQESEEFTYNRLEEDEVTIESRANEEDEVEILEAETNKLSIFDFEYLLNQIQQKNYERETDERENIFKLELIDQFFLLWIIEYFI